MQLRPYQSQAVTAVYDHLRTRDDNPCVVIPTAGGKTPIMATICRDAVQLWDGRVLMLAHVKELLEQAVDKLHVAAPDLWHQIGVYSAGLKSRDTNKAITVAGIQSVYRKACDLGRFDLILIDECHLLPPDGEGMYQQFLKDARIINPKVRLVGLTATPYRMTSGMICTPPPEGLLNHICYEIGVRELIVQGYLCPLKSKAGKRKADTSGLHLRGGEFIPGEVEALMDDEALVRSACCEIIEQTQDRHSVLIFAAGVKHAQHVQRVLEEMGHECGFVCGDTPGIFRDEILKRFKEDELKYLVNVNVLTTGFDAPGIDCVVLLRPTNSPGLYYQMVGRGFRLHPRKQDCLVLDYGGNVIRHGPVDALQLKDRTTGSGEAPAKECPECQALIHAAYTTCPDCGYEFPPPDKQKHDAQAHAGGVLSGEVTEIEYDVKDVYYSVHTKRGAPEGHPRTLRVDYTVSFNEHHSEWVCIEHPPESYARQKALAWWQVRSDEPCPASVEEAVELAVAGGLASTLAITVRSVAGEKYDRITNHRLGEKPAGVMTGDLAGDEPDYLHIPEEDLPF